jgi:hypothetical protein
MTSSIAPFERESYFDRGAWLTLAFMAVFCLMMLVTTLYILALPGDGWQMPYTSQQTPAPLVYFAGDRPTPLRAGDQVIAAGGVRMPREISFEPNPQPPGWGSDRTVSYTLLRNGQILNVDVTLHRLDVADILRSLWHAMQDQPAEWSWSLIAILVFLLRPRNPAARLLFIMGVSHSAVTKLGWAATTISHNFAPLPVFYLYAFTSSFWGYLFFPAITLLALSFPQRIFPLIRWPRGVPVLLFGLTLVLSVLAIALNRLALITLILGLNVVLVFLAFGAALVNTRKLVKDPVAKAQAMWVIFGFALSIAPVLPAYLLSYNHIFTNIGWLYNTFTILSLPVCLAIAITRYRLFDIEVIIRRTLQYGLLTGLLGLIYFGSVVLLQSILRIFAGDISNFAIVLSTLGIAALFNPLRGWAQDFIDRRFFRSKYIAEKVLEQFALTSREDVELERLTDVLLDVVEKTVQPMKMGLWLKPNITAQGSKGRVA